VLLGILLGAVAGVIGAVAPLGPRPLARAANAVLTALGNGGKASAELSSQTRTNSGLDTDDRRNSRRFLPLLGGEQGAAMDSDEQRQARERYPIKLAIKSALRLVASLARSASFARAANRRR
jgi:hypothetical protein